MSFDDENQLRKRSSLKTDIKNIIEKQTQDIQEAGALFWHRQSEEHLKYDVLMTVSPNGYHIIDALLQILNQKLPNLTIEVKPHSHNKEQAFYITANEEYLSKESKHLGHDLCQTTQSLTSLQKQTLILHFLNSLRFSSSDSKSQFSQNELKSLKLRENDAIIAKLISLNLIKQVLPLHNERDLSELRTRWVSAFFSFQPLDKICQYFGHQIAIYFAFLGYYTFSLIFPSILGVFITYYVKNDCPLDQILILSFTVLNIIWSTVFLQKWRHTNERLVLNWKATHFESDGHLVRPMFRENNIFKSLGNIEIERKIFKCFVTYPVIGLSLLFIFVVMIAVFKFQNWWDDTIIKELGYPLWSSYIPKIVLAILVSIFDPIYYKIAIWLNNKENYRLETNHENNLILKLIFFQFINSFLPLFYIAFIIGDMDKLREQLAALLITRQVIGNVKEALLPFLVESYKLSKSLHKIQSNEISSTELEANMLRYDSTFDDYLELIIQFGYVMIFSSTFPLAAVCALINNIIEIRSDAFKICVVYQRPFGGHAVQDIGQWEEVLNAIVYISIIVNSALIAKNKQISTIIGIEDEVQLVLMSVVIEHLLLALKWLSPFIF